MGRSAITSFIVREEYFVLVWNGDYEYEQFIQKLLNSNKQQATHKFFLNKCCFINVKGCNNKLS
jgi:hypothetical protein